VRSLKVSYAQVHVRITDIELTGTVVDNRKWTTAVREPLHARLRLEKVKSRDYSSHFLTRLGLTPSAIHGSGTELLQRSTLIKLAAVGRYLSVYDTGVKSI
jgi:hypothetical protein